MAQLDITEHPWYALWQKHRTDWDAFIDGFERHRDELEKHLEEDKLLLIYTNGFVLPNRPDIKGGVFNNDAAIQWDVYLGLDTSYRGHI